jgi:hypothetical protein
MSPVLRFAVTVSAACVTAAALTGCVSVTTDERTEDNSIVQDKTDEPNVLELER